MRLHQRPTVDLIRRLRHWHVRPRLHYSPRGRKRRRQSTAWRPADHHLAETRIGLDIPDIFDLDA